MAMTTTNKEKVKVLANRNITTLLDALGISYSDRGNLIQATCPCHQHGGDGDNDTAFSWRIDIGYWVCWTHHCQENLGNDIFGLVRSIKQCSFQEALEWISNALDDDVDIIPLPIRRKHNDLHIHDPLDETRLKFLQKHPQYLLARGYSPEVLDKYNVGTWHRVGSYMDNRVVIPVRDHEGFLVGFTGRTIKDKTWFQERGLKYAKWIHGRYYDRLPNHDDCLSMGSILFNLFDAKTYLQPNRRLILVEGPLDGFKLSMYGIYNWVASMGTGLTTAQRSLLVKYGVSDLYVAYDHDTNTHAGDRGWNSVQKVVGDLFRLHRIMLPPNTDPGDLEGEEIRDIFLPVSQSC